MTTGRPRDSRFTKEVMERIVTMRYQDGHSCEYISRHLPFPTTARVVSNELREYCVWEPIKLLKVPDVKGWDFSWQNLG